MVSSPFNNDAGKPLSKWLVNQKMGKNEDVDERRAVFVVSIPELGARILEQDQQSSAPLLQHRQGPRGAPQQLHSPIC